MYLLYIWKTKMDRKDVDDDFLFIVLLGHCILTTSALHSSLSKERTYQIDGLWIVNTKFILSFLNVYKTTGNFYIIMHPSCFTSASLGRFFFPHLYWSIIAL